MEKCFTFGLIGNDTRPIYLVTVSLTTHQHIIDSFPNHTNTSLTTVLTSQHELLLHYQQGRISSLTRGIPTLNNSNPLTRHESLFISSAVHFSSIETQEHKESAGER